MKIWAALAYMYDKSLDQPSSLAEAVNPVNRNLSKAIPTFDLRHNFLASYDWKLPLAKMLRHCSRWADGWVQFPVTLYNNNDTWLLETIPNGINNNGVDTPNYKPGTLNVNTNPRNGKPAFNTALFSLPELGQVGTAARRFFYGPGMANFDAAPRKNVRLSESRSLEFRLEAFNLLNHAHF